MRGNALIPGIVGLLSAVSAEAGGIFEARTTDSVAVKVASICVAGAVVIAVIVVAGLYAASQTARANRTLLFRPLETTAVRTSLTLRSDRHEQSYELVGVAISELGHGQLLLMSPEGLRWQPLRGVTDVQSLPMAR